MLFIFFLIATQAGTCAQIGDIEFFGYKGIDIVRLRKDLPVHEGDVYSDRTKSLIHEAVLSALGKPPTDVAAVCCDEKGNRLLFIGLPGGSYKPASHDAAPEGNDRLSGSLMALYRRLDAAIENAVCRGGDGIQEDDSRGYALLKDPDARALQLAVRRWALRHERELMRVLEFSSAVEHRRVASDALGYARQSPRQILGLVRAARDSDDEVRNNAIRALGVLARSNTKLAEEIPPATFIEMLSSGGWNDRNKATSLLVALTTSRNPSLLASIHSVALDPLIEMARWRRPSHAFFARMILGRVAGLPERQLKDLAWNGPVDAILSAVRQGSTGGSASNWPIFLTPNAPFSPPGLRQ